MDQLRKNGFWVVMGVLAVFALVLYFVLVGGVQSEIKSDARTLNTRIKTLKRYATLDMKKVADPEEGLPTKAMVAYWQAKDGQVSEQLDNVVERFKKADESFERLPGNKRIDDVKLADFAVTLGDRVKRLQKKYKALFPTAVAFSTVLPIEKPLEKEAHIPNAQKRYHMAEAVVEAAKAAGAQQLASVKFTFPAIDTARGDTKSKDKVLPVTAGKIGVKVSLQMRASGVPALVSQLLKSEHVVFVVDSLHMTKVPFVVDAYRPWGLAEDMGSATQGHAISLFGEDVYVAFCQLSDPETKEAPAPIEEPAVGVELELTALDFEVAATSDGGN